MTVAGLAALSCLSSLAAEDLSPLIRPNRHMAVIDTPHLHALVPADQVELLRPKIQRADAIYVHLAADAGYTISKPLTLWISDDAETHNGFSTTVPVPLVEIELAPSLPRSGIFSGEDEFERTITHEFMHHISNDRVYGLQRVTGSIFGRVFPIDYLSLVVAYFTVPPHVTMPLFWHEGLAQWAETAYADPSSPWAGRGRDSLTHMMWRLDAEAGAIPEASDWRASYVRWPYGNRVYLYGIAYTRWLAGAYGDRASLWRISDGQAHTWPFVFNGGSQRVLGRSHAQLLAQARTDLLTEQQAQLAILRSTPVTAVPRLTPVDTLVAAPAWLADGTLLTAFADPYDTSRLATVDAQGKVHMTSATAYDRGEARSLSDGTAVYAEALGSAGNKWARSRVVVRWPDGGTSSVPGERLLQPDLRPAKAPVAGFTARPLQLAAVQLLPGGRQEIALATWGGSWSAPAQTWATFPTEGRAWHPTFRPGHEELAWVETDQRGSRLLLAPLADPQQRTVLLEVHGRLIQPSWTADGQSLFVCADHTGVANAYRVDVAQPKVLVPVTNVIGGVTACVPSPDGRELALVSFDQHGPYLSRIANDATRFATTVPTLTLAWPAPVATQPGAVDGPAQTPTPMPPRAEGQAAAAAIPAIERVYWGVRELRFLFWTPSTVVTPYGGIGVQAIAADPLYTHQVLVGAGVGNFEHSAVGYAGYTWSPYVIGFRASAWRSEVAYADDIVTAAGNRYNYIENQSTVEGRAGWNLAGRERRLNLSLALGTTHYRGVDSAAEAYAGQTVISPDPFIGNEHYAEALVGFSDTTEFPTSFSREDGPTLLASYRVSGYQGLGGDLESKRLTALAAYTWSLLPHWGHQVVGAGYAGWSDQTGGANLQSQFTIGGNAQTLSPRGYRDPVSSGYYLVGYSAAYRLPLWRPFANYGTTPFGLRQVTLEGFYDGAQVSSDHLHGNGDWFRSTGGELAADVEVWALRFAPGLGVAQQLDGKKDTVGYVRLGYRW